MLPSGSVAAVGAKAGNPHELLAAVDERQTLTFPRRHAGFLEKIFQRAPRTARIGLQPFAAGAQLHRPISRGHETLIDACASRTAKAQLAAERGQRELRLPAPCHRGERWFRFLLLDADHAAI